MSVVLDEDIRDVTRDRNASVLSRKSAVRSTRTASANSRVTVGGLEALLVRQSKTIQIVGAVVLAVFLHVWLGLAITYDFHRAIALLVFICFAWAAVIWYGPIKWIDRRFNVTEVVLEPSVAMFKRCTSPKIVPIAIFTMIFIGAFGYLIYDAWNESARLLSIAGLFIQLFLCFVLSTNPSKVRWRPVVWGVGLQFVMGMLLLRWKVGHDAFSFGANQTVAFLEYAQNGSRFVYGILADTSPLHKEVPQLSATLIFGALQTVIYFGAVVGLLYYWGIIQFVLVRIATLMQWTLGTTAAESLNAAACIFLGQTEAALLIRPCLDTMTDSEIHAVMTAGYACIAGSLFAAYISFGACADYLLSASAMSAPASLAIAKLLMPETEESVQTKMSEMRFPKYEDNMLEAISNGAVVAVGYVLAIVANLVVIMSLLALVDAIFQWAGDMINHPEASLELLTGYIFFPLAYVMGSSNVTSAQSINDTLRVAELMGIKTIVNEFVAYKRLGCYVQHELISKRARMIATYALCGFSNIGSIGIQLGIMSGMCPRRSATFARVAVRGLLAGSFACFITACVAGILIPNDQIIECGVPQISSNCTLT